MTPSLSVDSRRGIISVWEEKSEMPAFCGSVRRAGLLTRRGGDSG